MDLKKPCIKLATGGMLVISLFNPSLSAKLPVFDDIPAQTLTDPVPRMTVIEEVSGTASTSASSFF